MALVVLGLLAAGPATGWFGFSATDDPTIVSDLAPGPGGTNLARGAGVPDGSTSPDGRVESTPTTTATTAAPARTATPTRTAASTPRGRASTAPTPTATARPPAPTPRPTQTADPRPTASHPPTPTARPAPRRTSAPPPPPEPTPTASKTPTASEETAYENKVVALTNAERADAGCGPLRADERLRTAARAHSVDMDERDYFDHTSPDGTTPWQRMLDAGYDAPGAENIALGYPTPEAVVQGWMHSPGHRRNILNCELKAIGVGVHFGSGGPWWTQDFGYR